MLIVKFLVGLTEEYPGTRLLSIVLVKVEYYANSTAYKFLHKLCSNCFRFFFFQIMPLFPKIIPFGKQAK